MVLQAFFMYFQRKYNYDVQREAILMLCPRDFFDGITSSTEASSEESEVLGCVHGEIVINIILSKKIQLNASPASDYSR